MLHKATTKPLLIKRHSLKSTDLLAFSIVFHLEDFYQKNCTPLTHTIFMHSHTKYYGPLSFQMVQRGIRAPSSGKWSTSQIKQQKDATMALYSFIGGNMKIHTNALAIFATIGIHLSAFGHGSVPTQIVEATKSASVLFNSKTDKNTQRQVNKITGEHVGHEEVTVLIEGDNQIRAEYFCTENEDVDPVIWECKEKHKEVNSRCLAGQVLYLYDSNKN